MHSFVLTAALLVAAPADWKIVEPVQKAEKHLSSHVKITGNKSVHENRGTLVSAREFPDGVVISGRFKMTAGGKVAEGNRVVNYGDCVVFACYTTAQQPTWSFEVTDGVTVGFNSAGTVGITHFSPGKEPQVLGGEPVKMVFENDRYYDVLLVASPQTLSVYVDGKHVKTVDMPPGLEGRRVAVYNRESTANVYQKTVVENLVTHPLGEGKVKKKRQKK